MHASLPRQRLPSTRTAGQSRPHCPAQCADALRPVETRQPCNPHLHGSRPCMMGPVTTFMGRRAPELQHADVEAQQDLGRRRSGRERALRRQRQQLRQQAQQRGAPAGAAPAGRPSAPRPSSAPMRRGRCRSSASTNGLAHGHGLVQGWRKPHHSSAPLGLGSPKQQRRAASHRARQCAVHRRPEIKVPAGSHADCADQAAGAWQKLSTVVHAGTHI